MRRFGRVEWSVMLAGRAGPKFVSPAPRPERAPTIMAAKYDPAPEEVG